MVSKRTVDLTISRSNLQAEIETMLRKFSLIMDDEDLVSMKLPELIGDTIPISLELRKDKEVEVINHN